MLRKSSPPWKASSTSLEDPALRLLDRLHFPLLISMNAPPLPNLSARGLGKAFLSFIPTQNPQGNLSPEASCSSMRIRIAQRRLPGILILVALLFSEFGSAAQSDGARGNLSVSAHLSDGAPKDSIPAPESPQREPLPGEEPEGSGEADDLDHRSQTNVLAIFPDHLIWSFPFSEQPIFLPARRRFLEFCKLKLDC